MRRFCFGTALLLLTAAAHAEDAADQPYLVLNTGGHTAPIVKVLFTPDGKEVVTVAEDRTVRLWDAATGERLGVLRLPAGPDRQGQLRTAALSADGKTLAVGGDGYTEGKTHVVFAYLIDLTAGRVAAALPQPQDVGALALSHDGKRLAVGCLDNKVYLWDLDSRKVRYALVGPKAPAADLAFSPDGALLAGACGDKTARLWSNADGTEVCPPLQHPDAPLCVAWKDNDTFATGGLLGAGIHLWDRKGGLVRSFDKLRKAPIRIDSVAFVPGREELFYTWTDHAANGAYTRVESAGAFLNLADPNQSRGGYVWNHLTTEVRGALSPDGGVAASSGRNDGRVVLWRVSTGKSVVVLGGRSPTPLWAGWGPNGRVVGWTFSPAAADVPLRAFDLEQLQFTPKPDKTFLRTVYTRDGLRLVWSFGHDLAVQRGDQTVVTLKDTPDIAGCYALLPGGRFVAANNDKATLYDAATGKPIRDFRGLTGRVREMAVSPDDRYLLGVCSDQVYRVWDMEQADPLLSLVVAGTDWAAWTPEGYYAASAGGAHLIGWQVNNGLEQLGTFYPAAQFHKSFYRPDVIKRVLAEGSVAKALAAADQARGKKTETATVARSLPPEVQILAPKAGKLDSADVEVRAAAESKGRPVASLRLLLDGRPFPGTEIQKFPKAKAGEREEATWKVQVPAGAHRLGVLAESDVSSGASGEVAVTYRPQSGEASPNLYVLAIGINNYPGSLELNWAVKDAQAIGDAFKAAGAPKPFGKVETNLLLDKQATQKGVLAGLDWLQKNMTADDTAVVFYAGHGHRDKKTGQFYLLPQDVDVADLEKTGVTGTQIKDKLKVVPGRVLVLLDACHSGSIGQSPADPAALADDLQRQLTAPDCGVVILCAAMAQEEAGEAAAVKHGFFTAALLKGLGGEAPRDRKDGLIHLTGLDYYVEQEVAELSNDEQHVVVDRPSTVTSFPLARPPKADEK